MFIIVILTKTFLFSFLLDLAFVNENKITKQYWQKSSFDEEVRNGKDTGQDKPTIRTPSTSYTSTLSPSSSSRSPSTSKSDSESLQQESSVSMTASYSKSSVSTASISSKSNSSPSQALNKGLNETLFNGVYTNVSQDFDPTATNLEETVVHLHNDTKYKLIAIDTREDRLESIEDMHTARIQRIKDKCSDKEVIMNMTYKGKTTKIFYGSENYNFTYCKVPKSGSTFWTKTFGILRFGLHYGESMFKLARYKIHNKMGSFVKETSKVIMEKSRTVLVSRDPFSRLFSAYIDKSFLLLKTTMNFKIRGIPDEAIRSGKSCSVDLTFQEFLDWIISQGKSGKVLDRHWSPIFSLCLPCDVNSFILIKQESFSQDVEYALKKVGVEKEKLDYIAQALHDHRAELSLPGIIDTLFMTANKSIIKYCLGYIKYSRRIWISLQIQGFIDEHVEFPVEKFDQINMGNSTYFTQVALQTLLDFPLTSKQQKQQRHRYLYKAYQAIKSETIQGIQELYKQDFELFGYSILPPTEGMEIK